VSASLLTDTSQKLTVQNEHLRICQSKTYHNSYVVAERMGCCNYLAAVIQQRAERGSVNFWFSGLYVPRTINNESSSNISGNACVLLSLGLMQSGLK
jgi:hypothetical protein